MVAHDQARELLAKELDEGERRFARLRVAVTEKVPPPPAKDAESEIAALRARLASVEEERDAAMEGRPAKRVATAPQFRGETTRDRPGRRGNLPMDARSTSRFTRCNVVRECHRSIEVVPRDGRCSHFVFKDSHSPFPLGQYRCVNVRALYLLRGVRVGEAQNPGPSHPKRRRRVSDSEVSSTFLDGFEADLRCDVTQLSPTVPASSGATDRSVGRSTPVGVECHRAASRRLVLVGDLNTTNSPVQETQVDVSATFASSIPATIPAQRAGFHCPFFERESSRTEPCTGCGASSSWRDSTP